MNENIKREILAHLEIQAKLFKLTQDIKEIIEASNKVLNQKS